jgi:GNAT superfamily N-acetyltransferase
MANIQTVILRPGAPEIALCARWRIDAFGDVLEHSIVEEICALETLAANPAHQAILIATCGGVPAGTCLLVPEELEPCHPVSPWLAGLYVVPEYRRLGIGKRLVRAVEEQTRERGHPRLFLYTDDETKAYYQSLSWRVMDRVLWKDYPTLLMVREFT